MSHLVSPAARRAASTAAIAIVVAVVVGGLDTVRAQEGAAPTDDGPLRIELIDQTFDLRPNGTIELSYRLTGDLDGVAIAPPPATVVEDDTGTVTPGTDIATDAIDAENDSADDEQPPVQLSARVLNYSTLDNPADVAEIVGSDPPSFNQLPRIIDGLDILDIRPLITFRSPIEAILELSVRTDVEPSVADRLEFSNDGIHPVVVEIRANDLVIGRHGTVVERRSTESAPPPIDFALFGAIRDPGPNATSEQVDDAVEEFVGLIDDSDAIDAGLTLSIPPSVIAAAVDAGVVDPDDPDLLVDDVLLAAPATPFDVSSAVAIDRADAFVRQLRVGEDEIAESIGITPVRDIWPATQEISAPAAQALRDLGVRYLAMSPELYADTIADGGDAPDIDRFIDVPLPDGGTMPILVVDDVLGAAFAAETTDEILESESAREWAVTAIAQLRVEQLAAPVDEQGAQRSHLIAVPGLGAFDPRLAIELESTAAQTEAARFTLATNLTSATDSIGPIPGVELPNVAGPSLVERQEQITAISDELVPVASMLPDGDPRPADWIQRLDSLISTTLDESEVDAELDSLTAEAQAIRDGVVAPDPFTFTLTGREGTIDIRIGNELDEPVNVVVRLSSPRLEFPDGDVSVTLPPGQTTVTPIPVVARSNGTSPVTVEILTPSLAPLTEPVTLTSRFTALTGLGQVLTGALLLILATWWFSHWRARRRAESPDIFNDDVSAEGLTPR